MDDIIPNKAIQSIISNLNVKCITSSPSENLNEVEGRSVVVTKLKDNQCDWTGMMKDIDDLERMRVYCHWMW